MRTSPTNHAAPQLPPEEPVYRVSRLNAEARGLLESGFSAIWVEGELSNLARPASGHWYFSLKDDRAQVRCAMFRQHNLRVQCRPEDGMQVRIRANVSLYEARGEFQLIVRQLEPAGEGALRQAWEELKRRLAAEGLFDERHKQPLPWLPRCIGVITSPSGAAVRDVLHVLRRRFPAIPVIIYPVAVQGAEAPGQIVEALRVAGERRECDVLILTRGGGSLEDLWSFNDEAVARALHACAIPTVAGVGHEVDFTIADFVADRRAPTPSAAAEAVTPDRAELAQRVAVMSQRLVRAGQRLLNEGHTRTRSLEQRLATCHPGRRISQQMQRLDELSLRLERATRARLHLGEQRVQAARAQLRAHSPQRQLRALRDNLAHQRTRLHAAARQAREHAAQRLAVAARALSTVSPLATLDRGYAIARRPADGRVISDAATVNAGEELAVRLARGELLCEVRETRQTPVTTGGSS